MDKTTETLMAVIIKKTGEVALVQRQTDDEMVVRLRGGQTRLFTAVEVGEAYLCCSVCWGVLDDGKCPNAERHEYDALYAASNDATRFNRRARRILAARAARLGRKIRRDA